MKTNFKVHVFGYLRKHSDLECLMLASQTDHFIERKQQNKNKVPKYKLI